MASLIAQDTANGLDITRYTGPEPHGMDGPLGFFGTYQGRCKCGWKCEHVRGSTDEARADTQGHLDGQPSDRTRYQITRLEGPQAGNHITLDAEQLAALATLIDGLMDLL
jgi:hypothetical protein